MITDNRIVFSSDTKPFTVNHRRVISIDYNASLIDFKATATSTGRFALGHETLICGMILEAAIRNANQKLARRTTENVDRHIPRDVRQRVWQRYGGKCVECQSDQYLEFDHVIPVAKGGSNFDNNIQLLCRRCNLKKSDHI